jgi:peptidoglycan/xylan/chitin deacetylase (PgdA/CDA1 family)
MHRFATYPDVSVRSRPSVTLMYHDVTPNGLSHQSGFPTPDAGLYKLDSEQFEQHLAALSRACGAPSTIYDLNEATVRQWMITFDDGGCSAYTEIAHRLEARGWRGHFFISTNYIDTPGFLTRDQIRNLHRQGHVIGSHSCSHPLQMARCNWAEMIDEWSKSLGILSEIVEDVVLSASIPGGQYSPQVAKAAAATGIKVLFTSEPTTRCQMIGECCVLGRYAMQRWASPEFAVAIVDGRGWSRIKQRLIWNMKKCLKLVGGRHYIAVRRIMIAKIKGAIIK